MHAALTKVVIPIEEPRVLNELDVGPHPTFLALGPARKALIQQSDDAERAAEKRRRSGACDVEVIANYGGIAVKRAGEQQRNKRYS